MGGDFKFDNLLLIAIIVIVLYQLLSWCMCDKQENKPKEHFAARGESCHIFKMCDKNLSCMYGLGSLSGVCQQTYD